MPQYAHFDPSAPEPRMILGWYDTDVLNYPNLPPKERLLEISAGDWEKRSKNPSGWAIKANKLVPYEPPFRKDIEQPPDRYKILEKRVADLEKRIAELDQVGTK